MDAGFKAVLENATQWQYYGTPNVGGPLKMEWNSSLVKAETVNIELWGYSETGERVSTKQHAYLSSSFLGNNRIDRIDDPVFVSRCW